MTEVIKRNSWVELRVEIRPSLAEAAANFLIEQGSPGIAQEEISGPANRKRECIIAYFPNNRHFGAIRKKIRAYFPRLCKLNRSSFQFRTRVIKQEKWAEAWKSNFKTIHVTPRLVVKPPWEKYCEQKGEVVIEIDPGMAFGTGAHPSTQMCLQALEERILSFPQPPSVLDVGTGSGILAIAGLKLGAKKVLAIDIDPVAIACARKNAAVNKIDGGLEFRFGSLTSLRRFFDIVVANLLPQELLSLAPALTKRIYPGGALIISGLLRRQKKEIISAYAGQGVEVLRSLGSKNWACLVLTQTRRSK